VLEESLGIAREIGDEGRVAAVLQPLSMAALGLGDPASAVRYAEEAVMLAHQQPDRHRLAAALNALAQAHRQAGALDRADALLEQMLTLSREIGNPETIAIGLLNHASVAIERGALHEARAMLREVLAIAETTGSQPIAQSVLEVAAGLAAASRCHTSAAWLYGAAEASAARTGIGRDPADERFLQAHVAKARAALGAAACAAAEHAGRVAPLTDALDETRRLVEGVSC
jgi:tetratricopeptide (TPR) repeat protein